MVTGKTLALIAALRFLMQRVEQAYDKNKDLAEENAKLREQLAKSQFDFEVSVRDHESCKNHADYLREQLEAMTVKRDVAVSSLELAQSNRETALKSLHLQCEETKKLREQLAEAQATAVSMTNEAIRHKHRAEAAEAKLKALEGQEPYGYHCNGKDGKPWLHTFSLGNGALSEHDLKNGFTTTKLYAAPNPASRCAGVARSLLERVRDSSRARCAHR